MAKTLYDKVFDAHIVENQKDGTSLLYVDRHLIHEVTSPQAFEGIRLAKRKIRQPEKVLAVADHNTPTKDIDKPIKNEASKKQLETLEKNTKEFGIEYFGLGDKNNGVCHIVGPELGFTLPGVTMVCGDSHTATHGAFGSIAFGIGTSEVEHVLATQTILQNKMKNMRINVNGKLQKGVYAKDIALYIIGLIGTAGGTGFAIEYAGDTIENLSMEGRMTICNLTIEAGARVGMIAPDETTFEYIKSKPKSPKGENWEKAVSYWKSLKSDENAVFDKEINIDASKISPQVTWGTSPEDVISIEENVPSVSSAKSQDKKNAMQRALGYIGLNEKQPIKGTKIDKVFIGSCTNGRIEDLIEAAKIAEGKKVASNVGAIVVPGSGLVRRKAQELGLDKIFIEAGFEWRQPGCSMCLAMNNDRLKSGERCASTSNRNFEGRQGRGGRTHLVSPAMAAAAAIKGEITDVREIM